MNEMTRFLKDEKIILKNLPAEFKLIARDENGDLNVYLTKPLKCIRKGYWESDNFTSINLFKNLFRAISWEDKDPVSILEIVGGKL